MNLKTFLNHYGKELTSVYEILKDIPKEDLSFSFTNIINNVTHMGKGVNPIPYIYAYLPNGYKTVYKAMVWKLAKYGYKQDKNGYLMIYNKITSDEKLLIDKMGGIDKVKAMDKDKLYYRIKDFTDISNQKLLENKGE